MSYKDEFQTVDLLMNSGAETRGVDAFTLSLIKAERQIRKLFTYLMFQFPVFSIADYKTFRSVLTKNRNVYFEGFINGFDNLYPKTVKDLVGNEYDNLLEKLELAIEYRNKIFHGQLTNRELSREELLTFAASIRKWCEMLASAAETEFGYDGFGRNSLRKSDQPIWKTYKATITSMDEYRDFLRKFMQRRQNLSSASDAKEP